MKFKKGFTLVEMLIVISILSVMGVLILNIFTRTLRGSNKSQIIANIKQNGQAVLENMDKTIRSSDNIVCTSANTLIVVKDGIYTRYRFILPRAVNQSGNDCKSRTTTARGVMISQSANGCIVSDAPMKGPDLSTGKEETDAVFARRVCADRDTLVSQNILTDTNAQTGISVENGLFIRERSAGFRDQVTIKFDIKPGLGAPQAVAGTIDPVNFQTSIQLR